MPDFELKDLLQAIGPSASLIFAAWIFLSFLQSRYSSAYEHYRQLIAELRTHREQDRRLQSLCRQILAYKRRCEQMRWATNIGVIAAMVLIGALIFAALGTMYDTAPAWKYLTAGCAIIGLLLVIWAASFVIFENYGLQRLLEEDISDVPGLVERAGGDSSANWSKPRAGTG